MRRGEGPAMSSLRGHETLVQLVGKRRNLSLSALSPGDRKAPSGVEQKEILSSVKFSSAVTSSTWSTGENMEIPFPANPANYDKEINVKKAGDVESIFTLKENICTPQQDGLGVCKQVSSMEWVRCPICSKSMRGGDSAINSHLDLCLQGGLKGKRQKCKQLTLSQFGSPTGTNKYMNKAPGMQIGENIKKENQEILLNDKSEGSVDLERPGLEVVCALGSHNRHTKAQLKQEFDHNERLDCAQSKEQLGRVLNCNGGLRFQIKSEEPELKACISANFNTPEVCSSVYQAAKIACACLCHSLSCKVKITESCDGKQIDTHADGIENIYGTSFLESEEKGKVDMPQRNGRGHVAMTASSDQVTNSALVGVLETKIVGRRFNRKVVCKEGLQVTVLREPDNPKDSNSIKIVPLETRSGPALGHLPREISRHLSGLLDKGCLQVWGSVTAVPEKSFGNASLKLYCERIGEDDGVDFTTLDDWQQLVLAAGESNASLQPSFISTGSKCQKNFLAMLQTILERDSHLFKDEEKSFLGTFSSMSADAQRLFIRLYQRKGPWFRLSSVLYKDVDDVRAASDELIAAGYMTTACNPDEASEIALRRRIEVLNVPELRQLVCASSLKKKTEAAATRREELISLAVSAGMKRQSTSDKSGASDSTFMQMLIDITGSCIRVSNTADFLLWRLQLDKKLKSRALEPCIETLLSEWRQKSLDFSVGRHGIDEVSTALEVAQGMDMALEKNDIEGALKFLKRARDYISCEEADHEAANQTPTFLARFSASYVYRNVCTLGISILERERRYKEAVQVLRQLLNSKMRSGRWGYWTVRLSINLDHLGCKEESLRVAEVGVDDPWIRGGDRVALQRRVVRLGKPPRRWKKPPYAEALKRNCKEVQIRGRPLNCTAGIKSRFYGYDEQQCGVEELALQYYASEEGGRWQGIHCEGGVWMTFFGLLMWDVLFADVPDVFQTSFQTAPLDLNTELFFSARQSLIETRLATIAAGNTAELLAKTWNENYGTLCTGVNWERHSLADLQTIGSCVGGPGLSHVCRLLAEDHAGWTGGMPDLLLWRTQDAKDDLSELSKNEDVCSKCSCISKERSSATESGLLSCQVGEPAGIVMGETASNTKSIRQGEAKLVEVKGPRDKLSEQQTAWIWILMNAGLSVEVCKVLEELQA